MIMLTKLNGTTFALNSDLIETIEQTPDTTIRLTTKNYYIVHEPISEVICKVVQFRKECNGAIDALRSTQMRRGE